MARIQSPPILSQIRVARNYSEQVASLRALKDEVVGHAQRKEKWVQQGVLESLVKILQGNRPPSSLGGKESRSYTGHPRNLTEDELVRLQSLQLLASFANGGPSFLGPLHAVGAIPAILYNIFPLENPPQIVLTALRALCNIADATSLAAPGSDDAGALAETLFLLPGYLNAMYDILASDSTAAVVQEQKCLVCQLISRLCKETNQQNTLADAGILDALATMLASFVVARGEVVPRAEILGEPDGLNEMIPDPAPRGANLAAVLEAISAIIADSCFRAYQLICSPTIMAVFPSAEFSPSANQTSTAWNALEMSGLSSHRAKNPGAIDYLLPIVPIKQPRSLSSQLAQFPPLGFSLSRENLSQSTPTFSGWTPNRFDAGSRNSETEAEEAESPLIPWLIHLTRTTEGLERVMAASVLTSLFKAGFANPDREIALGVLIVPLLCQLLRDSVKEKEVNPATQTSAFVDQDTAVEWAIVERTPGVLARLVADSQPLQQAAHDCRAMRMACTMLKNTYEPLYTQTAPRPWSPNPDRDVDLSEGLSTCRVGPPGKLPIYAHKIKMRENSLKLLAAMVINDECRKALDQDIVPYMVESLFPVPAKPKSGKEKLKATDKVSEVILPIDNSPYGNNPNSVLIAACHLMRAFSRSVRDLRTTLEDNGVAMPIFRLLKHPDTEVQLAASGVVCNMTLDFSPMRESLIEAGIIKVLCEYAHSLNPGLRLNSMWALKHLVLSVENSLKKHILEELGSGWLVRLICDETEDEALRARARSERRGDPNADDDEDMDTEGGGGGGYQDDTTSWSSKYWMWTPKYRTPCPPKFAALRAQSPRMLRAEKRLQALREAELNPTRKARTDDLAIQEQGLCFIRNLMGQPSASLMEMVDHVFEEIGQDILFDILASKLRVKVLHPFTRRYSAGRDTRVLYPQAKVIEAVIYVLVHIAASVPRHRQLVISQIDLLKLLAQHFNSKDIGVRGALCQLLTNLVWQDDSSDATACGQRAHELRKLGFLAKLETLEQADSELDIRERAKAAVWQMKTGNS
ncbi:armadillo-type protein [Apodospora peruviana]|uniref:Armadillo-type protein n=1 Tax=Apodospora peruviana TaxID=516989 RepID=A0AAE0HZB7_9PEZI|nr:armadillo-type protein [Apodospora peruviana]